LETYREPALAVSESDIVLLCVDPKHVGDVLKEISYAARGRVVVSTAARVPLAQLHRFLEGSEDVEVFRAVPNINVEVNKGFTALAGAGRSARVVEELFSLLGDVVWIDEELMDAITVAGACLPALVAEIMDAVIVAATRLGIPKRLVYRLVARVFEGTALSVLEHGASRVRDSVASPGGVTSRMLMKALEKNVKYVVASTIVEALSESP